MPVSASTKMDRFARAAEDVAAAERAIQLEIDRKEKSAQKQSKRANAPCRQARELIRSRRKPRQSHPRARLPSGHQPGSVILLSFRREAGSMGETMEIPPEWIAEAGL
jgi:hypothetical protein